MSGPVARTPWVLRDLARLVRFEGVAFVAIVVCFVGARHTRTWDDQLYWIVGAMAAMLVSGIGWIAWLLGATRKLRQRQRRLAELTARIRGRVRPDASVDLMLAAPRMKHFHRAGCSFVAGRSATAATAEEHAEHGLNPCPVCIG